MLTVIVLIIVKASCVEIDKYVYQGSYMNERDYLFTFRHEGKYGYMDEEGNIIVAPIYDMVRDFSEGLALVGNYYTCRINFCGGYINTNGEMIIKIDNFRRGFDFKEGLSLVIYVDKDSEYWQSTADLEWAMLIDKNGEVILRFDPYPPRPFSEGLSAIYDIPSKKWGYIDITGNYFIEPIYDFAFSFSEGLASVSIDGRRTYGYINKSGDFVIEPQFEDTRSFSEGFAVVWSNNKRGYINTTGEVVIPYIYDSAGNFSGGYAIVGIGNEYKVIDKSGNEIVIPNTNPADYLGEYYKGWFSVFGNSGDGSRGLTHYINLKGEILRPNIHQLNH